MASFSLSAEDQARTRDARFRDRRADERYEINAPGGCLNYQGSKYPCEIVDVSLSGCCVRCASKFLPGNLANVEVVLPVLGMVLRMVGTTQWVTRQNLIGVRFFHANPRSKNQLAGLLTGLADESVLEEIKAAMVASARSGTTALDMEIPDEWLTKPKPAPEKPKEKHEPPASAPPPEKKAPRRAGMVLNQDTDAWPAVLRLLKDGSHQNGTITGLSLEGCTFRTMSPFAAGLHARVEVDFQMRGLPFLLAGVTEDVRDKTSVDIRFLEMSDRKQGELAELIEELKEAEKNPKF
ncbi:MAG: PilZ domain-containing protein [Terracidiphilus sp.]